MLTTIACPMPTGMDARSVSDVSDWDSVDGVMDDDRHGRSQPSQPLQQSPNRLYERSVEHLETRHRKLQEIRQLRMKECTFTPETTRIPVPLASPNSYGTGHFSFNSKSRTSSRQLQTRQRSSSAVTRPTTPKATPIPGTVDESVFDRLFRQASQRRIDQLNNSFSGTESPKPPPSRKLSAGTSRIEQLYRHGRNQLKKRVHNEKEHQKALRNKARQEEMATPPSPAAPKSSSPPPPSRAAAAVTTTPTTTTRQMYIASQHVKQSRQIRRLSGSHYTPPSPRFEKPKPLSSNRDEYDNLLDELLSDQNSPPDTPKSAYTTEPLKSSGTGRSLSSRGKKRYNRPNIISPTPSSYTVPM